MRGAGGPVGGGRDRVVPPLRGFPYRRGRRRGPPGGGARAPQPGGGTPTRGRPRRARVAGGAARITRTRCGRPRPPPLRRIRCTPIAVDRGRHHPETGREFRARRDDGIPGRRSRPAADPGGPGACAARAVRLMRRIRRRRAGGDIRGPFRRFSRGANAGVYLDHIGAGPGDSPPRAARCRAGGGRPARGGVWSNASESASGIRCATINADPSPSWSGGRPGAEFGGRSADMPALFRRRSGPSAGARCGGAGGSPCRSGGHSDLLKVWRSPLSVFMARCGK
ncbi:hypothetical protein CLV63_11369 [Murinocardiopsis flavida]|uniref:Uncharacterized protein n=1 Tax=Murinocardiopsis flavida TaxID=645275 RepID=A0A2P8DFB5_9ACTN|nr:hypothetical protein CLV63_11369 [Murinocardiopsis flavida]